MADFEKINKSIDAGQDLVQAAYESTIDTKDDEVGHRSFVKNVDDFQKKIAKLAISDDKKLALFGDLDVFFQTEVITKLPLEGLQQVQALSAALEQKLDELEHEAQAPHKTSDKKEDTPSLPDFGLGLLEQTVIGIKDSFDDAQYLEGAKSELLRSGIEQKTPEQHRATVEVCQRQLERLGVQIKVQTEKIAILNKVLSSDNLAEAVRLNSSMAVNTADIITQAIHITGLAREKSAKIKQSIDATEAETKKILDVMYVSAYFEAKQSGDDARADTILLAAFDRLGSDVPTQLKQLVERAKVRAADAASKLSDDGAVFSNLYYKGDYAGALKMFAKINERNATLGEGLLKYSAHDISLAYEESTTTRAKDRMAATRGIEQNSPAGKKLAEGYVRLLFPQDTEANRYGQRLGRALTLAKKLPDGSITVSCFDASGQLRRLRDDVTFTVSPTDIQKSEKDEKFIAENAEKVMAKMPSFNALSKAAGTVQSKFEPMQQLFVAGKEGHMTGNYVENVKNMARALKADNGMDELKANLQKAKEDLSILRKIPAGQRGKFEQQLDQMEAAYSKAIKIIENDTVNDFCKKILDKSFTEDTLAEWIATEGIVMLSTIVGAIAVTALTFGAGGIVLASAAGALGGIVGSEVGHVVAEKASGHEYASALVTTLRGGKVWNHSKGTFEKLSASDVAMAYGGDFAQNFVSTLTIVGLGKMANSVLLKFAEAHKQNPGVKGTLARISELVFNLKPVEIDLLKKSGKLEKIFHHLIAPVGEEVGEEGISIALAQLNNDYADMVSLFFAMRGGRATHRVDGQNVEELDVVRISSAEIADGASQIGPISYPSSRESDAVNRLFEGGLLGIGRDNPISLKTDPSSAYRSTGEDQIQDIVNSGFVRPPVGKLKGGRRGEVHWSRGSEKLFYYSKSPVIEIDASKIEGNKKDAMKLGDLKAIWIFNETSQRYENKLDEFKAQHEQTKNAPSTPSDRANARVRRKAKAEQRASDPEYRAKIEHNLSIENDAVRIQELNASLLAAGLLKPGETLSGPDAQAILAMHNVLDADGERGSGDKMLLEKRRIAKAHAETKGTPEEKAHWRAVYEHALEEGFAGSLLSAIKSAGGRVSGRVGAMFSSSKGGSQSGTDMTYEDDSVKDTSSSQPETPTEARSNPLYKIDSSNVPVDADPDDIEMSADDLQALVIRSSGHKEEATEILGRTPPTSFDEIGAHVTEVLACIEKIKHDRNDFGLGTPQYMEFDKITRELRQKVEQVKKAYQETATINGYEIHIAYDERTNCFVLSLPQIDVASARLTVKGVRGNSLRIEKADIDLAHKIFQQASFIASSSSDVHEVYRRVDNFIDLKLTPAERKSKAITQDISLITSLPVAVRVEQIKNELQSIEATGKSIGNVGEALLRLKQNDPDAYALLKTNDVAKLEAGGVLYGMMRGEKLQTVDRAGRKILAYRGAPVNSGGMATISHVAYRLEGTTALTYSVIKEPHSTPNAQENFKNEIHSQELMNASGVSYEYIIKAEVLADTFIIYETGSNVMDLKHAREKTPPAQYFDALLQAVQGVEEIHEVRGPNGEKYFIGDFKEENVLGFLDDPEEVGAKLIDVTLLPIDWVYPGTFPATHEYGFDHNPPKKDGSYNGFNMATIGIRNAALQASGVPNNEINERLARGYDATCIARVILYTIDHYSKENPTLETTTYNRLRFIANKIVSDPVFASTPDIFKVIEASLSDQITSLNFKNTSSKP